MSFLIGMVSIQIGACGICCEYCPIYRREEKRCLGCEWSNEQLRKSGYEICAFWKCSKGKGVKCCFLCEEFPCQLHYGKKAIYTPEALNIWKKLKERGFELNR